MQKSLTHQVVSIIYLFNFALLALFEWFIHIELASVCTIESISIVGSLIFSVIALMASPVRSNSVGAPSAACTTLTPDHGGIASQTSPSPFELSNTTFQELTFDAYNQATHSYMPGVTYNRKL